MSLVNATAVFALIVLPAWAPPTQPPRRPAVGHVSTGIVVQILDWNLCLADVPSTVHCDLVISLAGVTVPRQIGVPHLWQDVVKLGKEIGAPGREPRRPAGTPISPGRP